MAICCHWSLKGEEGRGQKRNVAEIDIRSAERISSLYEPIQSRRLGASMIFSLDFWLSWTAICVVLSREEPSHSVDRD